MPRPLEDIKRKTTEPRMSIKKTTMPTAQDILSEEPFRREPVQAEVGRGSRYMLWSVAGFSVALLLLALSVVWSKAQVVIYPRTETVNLNDNFTAVKAPPSDKLGFELIVMNGEESRALEAAEEKELAVRASGTVVIFNDYTTAVQRLDVDTRLSGSNGKLFKTKKQITVPGRKADGSPGMVEVDIYAAEAGEDYNSGPLDFNIVGFKGTPKYESFKVRSKTGTEITGGFIGKTLVAGAEERDRVESELKTALGEELFKKATGEIPAGFILWKEATVFIPDKIELPLGDEKLVATLTGTLYGLLFKEEELEKEIAKKKAEGEAISIPKIRDLKFTLGNIGDVSLEDMNNITFNLSGTAALVWELDIEKFVGDLLGRPKRDFTVILSGYPNIDRAELSLSPFWKRVIPEERKKVDVILNYPEGE